MYLNLDLLYNIKKFILNDDDEFYEVIMDICLICKKDIKCMCILSTLSICLNCVKTFFILDKLKK